MTETIYQQTGLSVMVSTPLVQGGAFLDTLTDQFSEYRHEISADGGYMSASMRINLKRSGLEDWFSYGLGRDIKVFNPASRVIWEGFVNKVTISLGGYKVTRGPLLDLANRVQVAYSPMNNDSDIPVYGNQAVTAVYDNALSQSIYGIWHKILSAGELKNTVAANLALTYITENGYPATSQDLQFGGSEPNISIDCLGYVNWLIYPYNDRTNANVNISTKIQLVLAANPNAGIISTNYTKLMANTVQASRWEDQNRPAVSIINELTSAGNAAGTRHLFGIYANRQVIYGPIPGELEYQYKLLDGNEQYLSMSGNEIKPHDVMPGKWLIVNDFLSGKTPAVSSGLRFDPRNLFIERVSYTAPSNLRITGGKTDTLSRKLARWGTQGIGIPINRPT